jgi:cytochrome c oxidase subunit 4
MEEHPKPSLHEPDHDTVHHVRKHVKGYCIVGGVLLFCTALTVFLSYVDFGSPQDNIIVAMIVATFKAGLVAAIFMHLKSEKWTIYRFLLITLFFALGLFFLTGLAVQDIIKLN